MRRRVLGFALGAALLLTVGPAFAQPGLRALDAVWLTPRLKKPEDSLRLAASAGYGVTPPIAGGIQQRGVGGLAAGLSSRTGVALELRVDGHFDRHRVPGRDDSLSSTPRLYLRYGHALTGRLRAGVELAVWVPGGDAPSFDLGSTSLDMLAVGDLQLAPGLALVWALGPRIDQSAHSVSLARGFEYSPSDTLALGVSSYHALLSRLALELTRDAQRIGLELSADTLLGKGAPTVLASPLRMALVGGVELGRGVGLSAVLGTLLSHKQHVSTAGDYRPFEPQFIGLVALHVRFTRPSPHAAKAVVVRAQQSQTLVVLALDDARRPLPDVSVSLAGRELHTDADGRASFVGIAPGTHPVALRAVGFADRVETVRLQAAGPGQLTVSLTPQATDGLLQVLVRDLTSGEPLSAQLTLRRVDGKPSDDKVPHAIEVTSEGRWQNDLAPGRYTLGVRAPQHVSQTHSFQVSPGGVTQFNVDLAQSGQSDSDRP